jgi:hypothetical protein
LRLMFSTALTRRFVTRGVPLREWSIPVDRAVLLKGVEMAVRGRSDLSTGSISAQNVAGSPGSLCGGGASVAIPDGVATLTGKIGARKALDAWLLAVSAVCRQPLLEIHPSLPHLTENRRRERGRT